MENGVLRNPAGGTRDGLKSRMECGRTGHASLRLTPLPQDVLRCVQGGVLLSDDERERESKSEPAGGGEREFIWV